MSDKKKDGATKRGKLGLVAVNVDFEQADHERLKALAEKEERSVASQVRWMVRQMLPGAGL